MREKNAPVVLFVYNRPEHTQKTLECLQRNELAEKTDLYIFSDAPKNKKQEKKVNEVRKIIHQVSGFQAVNIVEAEKNRGLANSVITGVTDVIEKYGKVIVLEDDILTSKCFLKFMNDALDFYADQSKIWSLSGYGFPIDIPEYYKYSIYLSYRASSWGWATWKDRWNTIDWNIEDYNSYKYSISKIFHFCKGGTDLDKLLRYQMSGKIDSWAVRWCYNQSFQNKYTVYPVKSLATSIGTDGSGTHCDTTSVRFQTEIVDNFNYSLIRDLEIDKEIMRRFRKIRDRSIIRKIRNILYKS